MTKLGRRAAYSPRRPRGSSSSMQSGARSPRIETLAARAASQTVR
jgi:hypothetical protein